jgi:tRNA(fMet)-specific endonuclease VapC
MLYMLDTDVCVYYARKKSPQILARVNNCSPGDLVISPITYGELRFGAENSAQPAAAAKMLDEFTMAVPVVPLDRQVAEYYGKFRLHPQRKGNIIGANDLWIAAHCLQLGLTLVTNNEKEFRRIPNLAIENWTQ